MSELIGKKIVEVRDMTEEELKAEGWDGDTVMCLVLDDGSKLYPSRDEEGNGGGALFGVTPEGKTVYHYLGGEKMGYTHYLYQQKTLNKENFAKVVEDFKKIMPVFEHMGIPLASWNGEGKPEIKATEISFNGLEKCGHEERNLGITWPAKGAKGVNMVCKVNKPEPTDTMVTQLTGVQEELSVNDSDVDGTWFAGCKLNSRTCGGDCSHESFILRRTFKKPYPGATPCDRKEDPEFSKWFSCCKTAYKPYDLAVISALIIAKHHLGKEICVHSDGGNEDWEDGRILCQKMLGYGNDFKLDEE